MSSFESLMFITGVGTWTVIILAILGYLFMTIEAIHNIDRNTRKK
jgi:hypothetical protein